MEKKNLKRKFCAYCQARERGYKNPKDMLHLLVWDRGLTETEIAEKFGIQQGSVSALLKRFGVKGKSKGRRKIEVKEDARVNS